MKWTTKTGQCLDVKNMGIGHITNCILMLQKLIMNNEDTIFRWSGSLAEDLYGNGAWENIDNWEKQVYGFKQELKRRGIVQVDEFLQIAEKSKNKSYKITII